LRAAVIYDFKRAFLRKSTILLLILFVALGLGVSYLAYSSPEYRELDVAVVQLNADGCVVKGVVLDSLGNPANGARVRLYDEHKVLVASLKASNGVFEYRGMGACGFNLSYVDVDYKSMHLELYVENLWLPTGKGLRSFRIGVTAVNAVFRGFEENGVQTYSMVKLILVTRSKAKLLILSLNPFSRDLRPNYTLEYVSVENRTEGASMRFRRLGVLRDYVGVYELSLDPRARYLGLRVGCCGRYEDYWISYEGVTPRKYSYAGMVTGEGGLALFAEFFPIVFLYLAHVFMAKPRITGALEFIVARPVTRRDVYLTRYAAGVLVALISAGIMVLSIDLGGLALLGVSLDAYSSLIVYLGLSAALKAFYTLCYSIASGIRAGRYLAVSIILYLVFSMLWGLIVMLVASTHGGFEKYMYYNYLLSYLNPLGPYTTSIYYAKLHYGLVKPTSAINPAAAILSPAAWTAILLALGLKAFEKAELRET